MDKRSIGIIDSGLGGLSVTRVLREQLPHESVVFVGDQGHFPYGTKPTAQIQQLVAKISQFLLAHDVKMMIIACNTATAAALPLLQSQLAIPVLGVIEPGAVTAIKRGYQRVGVIATESTIKNGAYERTINKLAPQVKVISRATQPLVGIVEHGQTGTALAQTIVNQELALFDHQPIQALILGCTHFPFLQREISAKLGRGVDLIDPAFETVQQTKDLLTREGMLNDDPTPTVSLYSTGQEAELVAGAEKWLPDGYTTCEHIELGEE